MDLPVMEGFIDKLDEFIALATEVGENVEKHITLLHASWSGVSACEQKEFHDSWQCDLDEMIENVHCLRGVLQVAYRNCVRVQAAHARMWP